jgi:hypothetical protein
MSDMNSTIYHASACCIIPLLHCFSNIWCFCHIVRSFSDCAIAQAVICQFHVEADVQPQTTPDGKCGAQSDIENFSFPSTNYNFISTCTFCHGWYSSPQYQGTESYLTLSSVFFVAHSQDNFLSHSELQCADLCSSFCFLHRYFIQNF